MFLGFLRQGTAATRPQGPFLSSSDAKTPFTSTILDTDVRLKKHTAAFGAKSDLTDCTHLESGIHDVVMNTTDINTLGALYSLVNKTGALIRHDWWWVLPPVVYDAMAAVAGTDYLQVDVVQTGGATAPTLAQWVDALLDNAEARTVAGSIGKAIHAFTSLAARSYNADANSLFGVPDVAGESLVAKLTRGIVLVDTTIATMTSQVQFTLTDGSPDDDIYNDRLIVVTDATTGTQVAYSTVSDYIAGQKEVYLPADPGVFTMAVGDRVTIFSVPGPPANISKLLIDANGYMTVGADKSIDGYWFSLSVSRDAQDEYTLQWHYRDTAPETGWSVPKIRVIKSSDFSDLIPLTQNGVVQDGVTGRVTFKTSTKMSAKDGYYVVGKITHGGQERTFPVVYQSAV